MAEKGRYTYEWPRPMVTADAVVFRLAEEKFWLLLIRRGNEPYKGDWAIPGGFVELDEELEDAAARELEEEAGLRGIRLEQMRTFGAVGRDPRGRQITVVYMGIAEEGRDGLRAGDDAAEAKWFEIDDLPENMAFDHSDVAQFAIGRLKEMSIYRNDEFKFK
jgi:8-oxo-dGTP diphosphatase